MTFRFVICVDIEAEDLYEAYSTLYDRMAIIWEEKILDWESSDENYDEEGKILDPDDVQKARMAKFAREGMNN